jgi:hypothetical protein
VLLFPRLHQRAMAWLQTRSTPARRPAPRFRPHLETLEGRDVPSTLTVTNTLDSGAGSLRAEVTAARSKDTIVFAPGLEGQTITLTSGQLDITQDLTVQGPGAGLLAVSGGNNSRVFEVDGATTKVALSGLTITQGNGVAATDPGVGGGILNNGSTLTLSACVLPGNSALVAGGAIDNLGTLTVSGCTLSGNSTTFGGSGGAICNEVLATVTINQSTLLGNSANDATLPDGTVFLGSGGALCNVGTMTVSGCTLSGNSAGIGGALCNTVAVVISGGTYTEYAGTLTVRDSLLVGNDADEGGAIYNDSLLAVRGSTLSGNTASSFGGGLLNLNEGTATLQECSLSGNSAGDGGGGIFNSGTLAIKDSKVLGNIAPIGADLFTFGAVTLDDSSVGVIGP